MVLRFPVAGPASGHPGGDHLCYHYRLPSCTRATTGRIRAKEERQRRHRCAPLTTIFSGCLGCQSCLVVSDTCQVLSKTKSHQRRLAPLRKQQSVAKCRVCHHGQHRHVEVVLPRLTGNARVLLCVQTPHPFSRSSPYRRQGHQQPGGRSVQHPSINHLLELSTLKRDTRCQAQHRCPVRYHEGICCWHFGSTSSHSYVGL